MSTSISNDHTMKVIMIMGMQRSGTTALFETLSTARTLVSYAESPDGPIYDDYFLRPELAIRHVLRSSGSPVLLKPVRESGRRTLVSIIEEYADYDLSILWLYRDPVNVVFSYGKQGWLDATTVKTVALQWVARNRMVIELPHIHRHKVTVLRYEELVSDRSVLRALKRKLGVRARSTLRHDSNAGRARMPVVTQAQIDAITSGALLDLDRLRSACLDTGGISWWELKQAQVLAALRRQVPTMPKRSRLEKAREDNFAGAVVDFESERFQRDPHDCLRRSHECRRHHYSESGNVRSLSGYEEVADALNDSERFVFGEDGLLKDGPQPEEEQLRNAIAGAPILGSAELTASSMENVAREAIARQVVEGHFDLVNVCRVTVDSMFYQMLGIICEDSDGLFDRSIRGDSIDTLICSLSRGGWLSRVAQQTPLSGKEFRRFLEFGSFYRYVTAIFANNAVHCLLGRPGLVEDIRRAPDRFPSMFTELVRLAYPLLVVERWTRSAVEIAECKIPAHNLIYLAIGAANRDPAAFERPDEIVLRRGSMTTKKPLTGYPDTSLPCSSWEELGQLVCQVLLKVLLTTFPILEPVNPLGESKFTITQSSGNFRKALQIPFIRYLKTFEVKFQT